jgi:hypothetical protein
MDDLDFIADAMIEATGALHVAVTDGNHVYNIIQKLDRAICKARTLKAAADDLAEKTDILDCIRDRSSQVQPPPIPHQDHGQADQSPVVQFTGLSGGTSRAHNDRIMERIRGLPAQHGLPVDPVLSAQQPYSDDDIPTRIVRPHMTEGA